MTRALTFATLWLLLGLAVWWGLECYRLHRHPATLRTYLGLVGGVGVIVQGILVLLFDRNDKEKS